MSDVTNNTYCIVGGYLEGGVTRLLVNVARLLSVSLSAVLEID